MEFKLKISIVVTLLHTGVLLSDKSKEKEVKWNVNKRLWKEVISEAGNFEEQKQKESQLFAHKN